MKYHGKPPKDDQRLPPGTHRVKLDRVLELDSGDYLAILGNDEGEVTCNINPDLNDKKHAWRFWRLAGAFDYPDTAYWATDPDARQDRTWDPWDNLREIKERGTECIVVVSERAYQGKTYANIDAMRSIARQGEPKEELKLDTEVPF